MNKTFIKKRSSGPVKVGLKKIQTFVMSHNTICQKINKHKKHHVSSHIARQETIIDKVYTSDCK